LSNCGWRRPSRRVLFPSLASAIRMCKILPWAARYADYGWRYTSAPATEFVARAGVPQLVFCLGELSSTARGLDKHFLPHILHFPPKIQALTSLCPVGPMREPRWGRQKKYVLRTACAWTAVTAKSHLQDQIRPQCLPLSSIHDESSYDLKQNALESTLQSDRARCSAAGSVRTPASQPAAPYCRPRRQGSCGVQMQ
jgi:hypothetical protein